MNMKKCILCDDIKFFGVIILVYYVNDSGIFIIGIVFYLLMMFIFFLFNLDLIIFFIRWYMDCDFWIYDFMNGIFFKGILVFVCVFKFKEIVVLELMFVFLFWL